MVFSVQQRVGRAYSVESTICMALIPRTAELASTNLPSKRLERYSSCSVSLMSGSRGETMLPHEVRYDSPDPSGVKTQRNSTI